MLGNASDRRFPGQEQKPVSLESRWEGRHGIGQVLMKIGRQDDHDAALLFEMRHKLIMLARIDEMHFPFGIKR